MRLLAWNREQFLHLATPEAIQRLSSPNYSLYLLQGAKKGVNIRRQCLFTKRNERCKLVKGATMMKISHLAIHEFFDCNLVLEHRFMYL